VPQVGLRHAAKVPVLREDSDTKPITGLGRVPEPRDAGKLLLLDELGCANYATGQ